VDALTSHAATILVLGVSIDEGDLPNVWICRVRDMGGSQSAIRMSVACKVIFGT
jgi:hypothetical protein